jgi:hypothetical protein
VPNLAQVVRHHLVSLSFILKRESIVIVPEDGRVLQGVFV